MSRYSDPNGPRRAEESLRGRGVDLGDLTSMVSFIAGRGGSVRIEQHSYQSPNLVATRVQLNGREHSNGGHVTDAVRRSLVELWVRVLIEGERNAVEAHVPVQPARTPGEPQSWGKTAERLGGKHHERDQEFGG